MNNGKNETNNSSATTATIPNLYDYTKEELLVNFMLAHYEILNLQVYVTQNDIKKAYHKCSLKKYPDKMG
jgi:DnaJ-class molecular chaperone